MGALTSQFGDCDYILYWSRIRKFVTYRIRKNVTGNRQRIDREQTEKAMTEATLIAVLMERRVERGNIP